MPDHRGDQALFDRHGHAHVDLVPVSDVIVLPPGVARGVLPQRHGRVVIFVDEIDAMRSLPFSTDEFFAAIP
jgi:hypothetical protein